MKLKQLKQWLEEAEKSHGENAEISIHHSVDDWFADIENMTYDFSDKVLRLEIDT